MRALQPDFEKTALWLKALGAVEVLLDQGSFRVGILDWLFAASPPPPCSLICLVSPCLIGFHLAWLALFDLAWPRPGWQHAATRH
jgi:hypothetical protein